MTNNDKPTPFNKGGEDVTPEQEERSERLLAALRRLTAQGDAIRIGIYTGDASSPFILGELFVERVVRHGENDVAFLLSDRARDSILTALANGKTLILRVTRGMSF